MSQICKVCNHPEKKVIEKELVRGVSKSVLARRYNVSRDSLYYHESHHLGPAVARSVHRNTENHRARLLQTMLSKMDELSDRAEALLTKAEETGQIRNALLAIQQLRNNYELAGKIIAAMGEEQQAVILENHTEEQSEIIKAALRTLTPNEKAQYIKLNMLMIQRMNGVVLPEPEPAPPSRPRMIRTK